MDNQSPEDTQKKKICIACQKEYTGDETTCPDDGTNLTPLTSQPGIGTKIDGKYEVLAVIGGGAMGLVYKAKHTLMKRIVAVKMLHPNMAPEYSIVQRFQKEAEAVGMLNHPNILTVYEFGIADRGQPYLVTDFLEGETLSDLLDEVEFIEYRRVLRIFRQVTDALAHAHEKGVIHRDLKPSNIMLVKSEDEEEQVKILDFGIAKVMAEDAESGTSQLTKTGEVFGSPLYMSPEQCRGKPLDQRSDIYSLGCVIYRALVGEPALFGQDLLECLYKHVNEEPPAFKEVNADIEIPAALEAVVMKCLKKAPEDRYQSMRELREHLDSLQSGEEQSVETHLSADRSAAPVDSSESGTTGAVEGASASASSAIEKQPDVPAAVEKSVEDTLPLTRLPEWLDRKKIIAVSVVVLVLVMIPVVQSMLKPGGGDLSDSVPVAANPFIDNMQDGIEDFESGDYFEASEHFFKALTIAKKDKLSKSKVSKALHHLILATAGSKEFERSKTYLKELEKLAGVKGWSEVPDTVEKAEAYFDKAYIMISSGSSNLEEASGLIFKAREYYEAHEGNGADTMRCMAALGTIKLMEHDFGEAKKCLSQAVVIAKEDPTVSQLEAALRLDQLGDSYIMVSSSSENYFDDALAQYKEALELRKEKVSSDDHPALAQSYLRIGVVDFLKKSYDEALNNLNKSLSIREKLGKPLSIAEVKRSISYVYLAQGKKKEATSMFNEAVALAKKAGKRGENQISQWKHVFKAMGGSLKG